MCLCPTFWNLANDGDQVADSLLEYERQNKEPHKLSVSIQSLTRMQKNPSKMRKITEWGLQKPAA